MYLVEYDVGPINFNKADSKPRKGIFVKNYEKIESNDYPESCIIYPKEYLGEDAILVSNNGYKLKVWTEFED